jgi:tripartite-type tricarboxylate transporter receptor subunit TctC
MPRLIIALALSLLATLPALAQSYPSRPIRLIVPFAPGASSDATARALAQDLGQRLGQNVVVENNGGGGGVTGLQQMARSAPDGHTLGIGAAGAVVIIPLMPGAPAQWDPAKDLLPVSRLVDVPLVIVGNPTTGPKTLKEAIEKAKSNPDGLTFGSTGTNSGMHLAVEYLSFITKARLVHVPYRGSSPAVMDAVSGQIPLVAVDLTSARPQLEAGKVTGLAMISDKRVSFAPNVPSLGELGFPGYESQAFLGLFAPMGTPPEIVKVLSDHVREIVAKPEFVKQMHTVALEPAYLDAPGFAKFLETDRASWRERLRAIGKLQ